jgi:Lactate dehydrogenase and related dehydrogenases
VTRPSVLVLDDREGLVASSPGVTRMRRIADVRILPGSLDQLTEAELAGVRVLLAIRERTRLDAATLARLPALELILQTGGHAYHLDTDYTASHGIPVTLSRGALGATAAVPELTFALAVAALRMIPAAHRSMTEGEWRPFMGRTLRGRTLGILGLGRQGAGVARIGKAYGMHVVAWQRTPDSAGDDVPRLGLDELLASSDVVSVHLRLSEDSRGLLDARKLALMKPGSVLINTARGAIVDEPALVWALRSGGLSAAGLDVFSEEPLPADSPLRSLDNVVLTPHIGWTVEEVLIEWIDIAARQLEEYLGGSLQRKELLDPAVLLPPDAAGGLAPPSA